MTQHRLAPIAFGFLLSGMMSLIVSGIATARAIGLDDGFVPIWLGGWLSSWVVAFTVVLVVAPLARRAVNRLFPPQRA